MKNLIKNYFTDVNVANKWLKLTEKTRPKNWRSSTCRESDSISGFRFYIIAKFLRRNGWIDKKYYNWSSIKTIDDVRKSIEEHNIICRGREQLFNEYRRLWQICRDNNWLDDLFEKLNIDWSSIKTINDAKKFIEEHNITSRGQLKIEYNQLYQMCRYNKWLDDLFGKKNKILWRTIVKRFFN